MDIHRKIQTTLRALAVVLTALLLTVYANGQTSSSPLASWNDGSAKKRIFSFVKEVTAGLAARYVEPQDRIATFDQDGTFWGSNSRCTPRACLP